MNRQILFKAKRKCNGEWVEGYYRADPDVDAHFICGWDYYPSENGLERESFEYEIDPGTICQYTGLFGKNGEKIWENDIISISAYSYDEPEDDYFGIVAYSEKDACWCLKNSESSEEIICICECFGSYTTEIINRGNIFDNPELLEE